MDKNRRKRKRIRNLINIAGCTFCLLLVLLIFRGVGYLLEKHNTQSGADAANNDATESTQNGGTQTDDTQIETETEDAKLIVCLDPGHGGKDPGTNSGERYEKDDVLKLANKTAEYLRTQDVEVVMTRTGDEFPSLEERAQTANESNADYFVSFHRNEGEGYGVECWVNNEATSAEVTLAENIMSALETVGIQRNRGVKYGSQGDSAENYYVNNHTDMTSCLIEFGFINDTTDNELFDAHLDEYGKAIGEAILRAAEESSAVTEPETETENTTTDTSDREPNTIIENVSSLDGTCIDYGHGSNTDENNRPDGATMYQEKYGDTYNAIFIKEADEKKIYLTFDEGYEYGYSESILNTLKEKNVKAVFFVTKPYAVADPELVQRMIDEGHTVGNHSVNHPANGLPSETIDEQTNEVMETHEYVKENFGGYEMHYFRFPAGKFSEQSLAIVNNCNYTSVFWSFAYYDYDVNNQPDQTASLQKLMDKLHPGAVYLLHAESETNAAILGQFIDDARAAGYEFAQLL